MDFTYSDKYVLNKVKYKYYLFQIFVFIQQYFCSMLQVYAGSVPIHGASLAISLPTK